MADGLVWEERPPLRRPVLVAAFAGWNDAGDAATGATEWLLRHGDAERFAWIDPDEFVDYQSHRPVVELVEGVTRSVAWPATECSAAAFGGHSVVVVRGVEPNVRWREYCDTVLTVAAETGCEMVVTLGALIGDVPHTRNARITGTASDPGLVGRLDLVRSQYEGPTGIVGVFHDACRRAGVRSVSLWAPVPHYVSSPPNPPATRALLERLAALVELPLDLHSLDQLVDLWRAQVDRAIEGNDEITTYIRELEAQIDAVDAEARGVVLGEAEPPDASALADEVERFLREQGGNP